MAIGGLPFEFGDYLLGKPQSQITATQMAMQQQTLNQQLAQYINWNMFHNMFDNILKESTFIGQLQKETDEWLKGVEL